MAIPFAKFTEELHSTLEMLKQPGAKIPGVQNCVECDIPLQESVTGCRATGTGYVCSDCYFEAFGKELDASPLGMYRSMRGG